MLARQLASREIVEKRSGLPESRQPIRERPRAAQRDKSAAYTNRYPGLAGFQAASPVRRIAISRSGPSVKRLSRSRARRTFRRCSNEQGAVDLRRRPRSTRRARLADRAATNHLNSSRGESSVIAALRRDRSAATRRMPRSPTVSPKSLADRAQAASINSIVRDRCPGLRHRVRFCRVPVLVPAFAHRIRLARRSPLPLSPTAQTRVCVTVPLLKICTAAPC